MPAETSSATAVREFFEQNGCIDLEHAARLGVGRAGELTSILKDGIMLETSLVSSDVLRQVNEAVTDCLKNSEWLDVLHVVPLSLSLEDATILMGRSEAIANMLKRSQGEIVADTVVISSAFIKSLSRRYSYDAKLAARHAVFGVRTEPSGCDTDNTTTKSPTPRHPGSSLEARQAAADCEDDFHDEVAALADDMFDMHMKPTKGKKRGKDGKRVQKDFSGRQKSPGAGAAANKLSKDLSLTDVMKALKPRRASVRDKIVEWYPDTEFSSGSCESLADVLAMDILPAAVEEFDRALESLQSADHDPASNASPGNMRLVEIVSSDGASMFVEMHA